MIEFQALEKDCVYENVCMLVRVHVCVCVHVYIKVHTLKSTVISMLFRSHHLTLSRFTMSPPSHHLEM